MLHLRTINHVWLAFVYFCPKRYAIVFYFFSILIPVSIASPLQPKSAPRSQLFHFISFSQRWKGKGYDGWNWNFSYLLLWHAKSHEVCSPSSHPPLLNPVRVDTVWYTLWEKPSDELPDYQAIRLTPKVDWVRLANTDWGTRVYLFTLRGEMFRSFLLPFTELPTRISSDNDLWFLREARWNGQRANFFIFPNWFD